MAPAQVYIVRIWTTQSEPHAFRASVRAVEQEESHFFTRAEDLGPFFAAQLAPPAQPAAETGGDECASP